MDSFLYKTLEIDITDIGIGGEGIGSFQGFKIFVPGALPLEFVQVRIESVKPSFALGKLIKILKTSPQRVEPICPLFSQCGGCQIMHLDYAGQLEVKRKRVEQTLIRIGKMSSVTVPPVTPSPTSLYYRNKIQLPVAGSPGNIKIGLYARGSHEVVDVQTCFLHHPVGDRVYQQMIALLKASKILPYDTATKEGELRHILMRSSEKGDEVLIVLITPFTCSKELKKIAHELSLLPGVVGVIHHKNPREDNVVLDREFTLLYGRNFIEQQIGSLTFKVSAASFFQVNLPQAEQLYQKALALAQVTSESRVVDAYCGIGTLSLLIAQKAHHVIGIECVSQAIQDAQENAARNGIQNAEFICGPTEKILPGLSSIDVVFLNPPRKGCDPRVLKEIHRLSPQAILYISCDPATLARDTQLLSSYGFVQEQVHAFDMFPQTTHVETVAKFIR